MSKPYKITEEQQKEIAEARKENKNKNVERRLKAIALRAEGKTLREIGEQCGYHPSYISNILSAYNKGGLEAIIGNHYTGNRRTCRMRKKRFFWNNFANEQKQAKLWRLVK